MVAAAVFSSLLLAYTLVSRRLEGGPVSAALVFSAGGVITGLAGGADLSPHDLSSTAGDAVRILAELALALILFADASTIGLRRARSEQKLPDRLLGIGLPLTIGAGVLAALALLGGLEIWLCVLLAALLAPTDAALAAAVVSDERVPGRVRRGLDIEAGLNDGVCVPVVVFALAAAVATEGSPDTTLVHEALVTIVGGTVVGVITGSLGGRLLALANRHGTIADDAAPFAVAALAFATFFAADIVGASGFIAAFVGGLFAARWLGEHRAALVQFTERDGTLLSLTVFFAFGIVGAGVLGDLTAAEAAYAVLSLTVVRMLPVALVMLRTGFAPASMLYIGWFGPRGLASIVFATVVVEDAVPGATKLIDVVLITVAISMVVHGVTAAWGAGRYATWFEAAAARNPDIPEAAEAADPVVQRRTRVE